MSALTRARRGNTVHWVESNGAHRSGIALEFSSDSLLAARGVVGMNAQSLWVVPYSSIVETSFGPDRAHSVERAQPRPSIAGLSVKLANKSKVWTASERTG